MTLCVLLVLFATAGTSAKAQTATSADIDTDTLIEQQREELGLDDLDIPDEADELLEGIDSTNVTVEGGFSRLMGACVGYVKEYLLQGLYSAGAVFVILLLCGVVSSFAERTGGVANEIVPVAGTLAICAVVLGDMSGLIGSGRETMEDLMAFSKGLILSLATASGVVGAPAGASAKYVIVMTAGDVCITLLNSLFMPLLYAYSAAVVADAATGEEMLGGVAAVIKKVCIFLLSAFLTLFIALLGLSGLISGGADAVTMKTAKLVISNAVPVVGSILSDATESVVAAARIVRNSAGLLGLFAVAAVCIGPLIRLGTRYLLFRAAGAAAQPVAPKRLTQMVSKLADGFSILLGMIGACSLMNLISIVAFMRLTGAY